MVRTKKRAQASRQNGTLAPPPEPEPLSTRQLKELNEEGFVLVKYGKGIRTNVQKGTISDLVAEIVKKGAPIFNNAEVGPGDGTRLQLVRSWSNLPGKAASIISKRLEATFPHLIPGDAQFLLSLAHGHDQRPHLDVTAGHDLLEDPQVKILHSHIVQGRVPLSVIITFGKPAKLHVWPRSMDIVWAPDDSVKADAAHSRLVRIPPYSALVFRQDLVHAGSAYDEANFRIHFYMDLKAEGYITPKGITHYADETFWLISA